MNNTELSINLVNLEDELKKLVEEKKEYVELDRKYYSREQRRQKWHQLGIDIESAKIAQNFAETIAEVKERNFSKDKHLTKLQTEVLLNIYQLEEKLSTWLFIAY